MAQAETSHTPNKPLRWLSYVLSALPALLLGMSGVMKLVQPPSVTEGFAQSGLSATTVAVIGVIELLAVAIYLVPQTAVLGAILVTGYLGGAVFVHLAKGEVALLAPLLLGVFAWGGLFLRDPRVAALIPWRRQA